MDTRWQLDSRHHKSSTWRMIITLMGTYQVSLWSSRSSDKLCCRTCNILSDADIYHSAHCNSFVSVTSAWIRLPPVSIRYTVERVHLRSFSKHNCTQPFGRYNGLPCPYKVKLDKPIVLAKFFAFSGSNFCFYSQFWHLYRHFILATRAKFWAGKNQPEIPHTQLLHARRQWPIS